MWCWLAQLNCQLVEASMDAGLQIATGPRLSIANSFMAPLTADSRTE